jgi:hypothetical protein
VPAIIQRHVSFAAKDADGDTLFKADENGGIFRPAGLWVGLSKVVLGVRLGGPGLAFLARRKRHPAKDTKRAARNWDGHPRSPGLKGRNNSAPARR